MGRELALEYFSGFRGVEGSVLVLAVRCVGRGRTLDFQLYWTLLRICYYVVAMKD
jgi:hypothetical protein